MFSDMVPGLATTEGIYEVELRATDRLARTSTVARCFNLHLRAPPLEFEVASGSRPTKVHTYALDSLGLEENAPYYQLAARLLNYDATGASLIDQDVFNGTPATVFLTVTVTKPLMVMAAQSFVVNNAATDVTDCGDACDVDPMTGPVYESLMPGVSVQELDLTFPVKVFEVVSGVPAVELPCIAPCSAEDNVFKFAIPPRAPGVQPARMFRVMTMIGRVGSLWPRDGVDGVHTAAPPFVDEAITWTNPFTNQTTTTKLTGIVDHSVVPERTGCVRPFGGGCLKQGAIVPYRALRYAALTFSGSTVSEYATAATAALTPVQAAPDKARLDFDPANNWSTFEGVLPRWP
jgi:hypothetical protein